MISFNKNLLSIIKSKKSFLIVGLDPNLENDGFLHDFDYNKIWRIPSYEKLEEKIIKVILENTHDPIISGDSFCLDSEEASKRLVESFKNI